MAYTQYQIFIRYFNENVNKPITNRTPVEWVGAEELINLKNTYTTNLSTYNTIKTGIANGTIKRVDLTQIELDIYEACKRYEDIKERIELQDGSIVQEWCDIRSYKKDYSGMTEKDHQKLDAEKYQIVIDESSASNPKNDMIFMYDGIINIEFVPKTTTSSGSITTEIYIEKMKRIKLDPWFLHSTWSSLSSAMHKAEELVSIIGKDAVKIGKVVPLDQYIEIV